MKRFLKTILTIILLSLITTTTYAQTNTISVVGRGTTKEEAIQNALKTAVEKATGVFIYSVTEVKDFDEIKEKVVAQSRGYVKDYKIIDEKVYDDMIILIVNVTVDTESIKSIMRKDIKAVTYDDVLKDYSLVKQKIDRLRKAAELLKAMNSRPIKEMYSIDYVGYEITDVGLEEIKGIFYIRVSPNPFFWDTYWNAVEQVSEKGEKGSVIGNYRDENKETNYPIHPDLEKYFIKLKKVELRLEILMGYSTSWWEYTICLYQNFFTPSSSGQWGNYCTSFYEKWGYAGRPYPSSRWMFLSHEGKTVPFRFRMKSSQSEYIKYFNKVTVRILNTLDELPGTVVKR